MSEEYKAEKLALTGYLMVAVRLMQTADPYAMASEAAFKTIDMAADKASEAVATLYRAHAKIDTGALLLLQLVLLYGWRSTNYIAAQGKYTPFSKDEKEYFDTAVDLVAENSKEMEQATGIADVPFDIAAHASLLQAPEDKRREAATQLVHELWKLCVHPHLELRES